MHPPVLWSPTCSGTFVFWVFFLSLSFKARLNLIPSEVSTAVIALLHNPMPLIAYQILNYHINLHSLTIQETSNLIFKVR